jgi:hypothetical protein
MKTTIERLAPFIANFCSRNVYLLEKVNKSKHRKIAREPA